MVGVSHDHDAVYTKYLALPWAGESAGVDMETLFRSHLGVYAPREWVYPAKGKRPDPGGGGVVGIESRISLEWFPLEADGTCTDYPLLSSITSLAVTSFGQDQLSALVNEIDDIMPHLTDGDAAFFASVAFMAEEALLMGRGSVEFTPI
jgi:hypothetical protein